MQAILKERLDGIDVTALTKQVRKMLEREPLTFAAIREEFLRADPKADERAMGYAVRMLLPLVQVPVDGQAWAFPSQACFAPAEQWLDKAIPSKAVQPDALLLRYLEGYGPASADDMRAWSGLARPAVKEAIDRLRPKLSVFRDGKRELFDSRRAAARCGCARAGAPDPGIRQRHHDAGGRAIRGEGRSPARVPVGAAHRGDRARRRLRGRHLEARSHEEGGDLTIEPFKPLAARVKKEVEAEAESVLKFAEPEAKTHEVRFAKACVILVSRERPPLGGG